MDETPEEKTEPIVEPVAEPVQDPGVQPHQHCPHDGTVLEPMAYIPENKRCPACGTIYTPEGMSKFA